MMRALAALLALGLLASPAAARDCPASQPDVGFAALPHFTAALAAGKPVGVLVVGLGGARAGGQEGPFAQTLAAALERGLAGHEVRVQILPTPGMLAKDSAERLRRAAAEVPPALVIWRTGLSDALAMTDPAKFAQTVRRVAEWLAAQEADLVLVDLAYHAGGGQEGTWRRYVEALGTVGRGADVPVFRRYAIMERWAQSGAMPHPAAGEACLAELLATAILRHAAR